MTQENENYLETSTKAYNRRQSQARPAPPPPVALENVILLPPQDGRKTKCFSPSTLPSRLSFSATRYSLASLVHDMPGSVIIKIMLTQFSIIKFKASL